MEKLREAPASGTMLKCLFLVPENPKGYVIFAHGRGTGSYSPRNLYLANAFLNIGIGSVLVDLYSPGEVKCGLIPVAPHTLAHRLKEVCCWAESQPETRGYSLGYLGGVVGGAVGLIAAAMEPNKQRPVICRGSNLGPAMSEISKVPGPVFFIVGSKDQQGLIQNQNVAKILSDRAYLFVVPHAGAFFEEPGALESVASRAAEWFLAHIPHASNQISAA